MSYCCYCGKRMSRPLLETIDHVIPRSRGGNNRGANRQGCCNLCNCWKADYLLHEWKEIVKASYIKMKHNNSYTISNYTITDLDIILINIDFIQDFVDTTGIAHFILPGRNVKHYSAQLEKHPKKGNAIKLGNQVPCATVIDTTGGKFLFLRSGRRIEIR